MVRVKVSPAILEWVERRYPSVRSRFPQFDSWMRGERQPTLRQLEELAKKMAIPLGYFFFTDPPKEELPIPFFRTQKGRGPSEPSPEFMEMLYILRRRQAWMREYLEGRGYAPLPFVGKFADTKDPIEVTQDIRQVLRLEEDWAAHLRTWKEAFQTLRKSVEKAGIVVVSSGVVENNPNRALDPTEFRGFVLIDPYAPFIFINAADAKAAQIFTLAHELAHIWLGKSAAFDLEYLQPAEDEIEKACNQIAAEFLVPSEALRKHWRETPSEKTSFQDLAQRFKVSELVIARRALDLGLITKKDFFEFYEEYRQKNKQKRVSGGGNFYATQVQRLGKYFARSIIQAVQEGSLLYHEAYRLTGLYGRTFARFVERGFQELRHDRGK